MKDLKAYLRSKGLKGRHLAIAVAVVMSIKGIISTILIVGAWFAVT